MANEAAGASEGRSDDRGADAAAATDDTVKEKKDGDASAAAVANGGAAPEEKAQGEGGPSSSSSAVAEAAGARRGGPGSNKLSADAAEFVPGHMSEAREGDILARLPPQHRMMLRGTFMGPTGEYISYYVGRLKSFNNRTGYGFLECLQAHNIWATDVFIHKNFVPNPWHIGQFVEFAVQTNGRGQPQAFDVNWLPQLPEAGLQPRRPAGPPAAAAGAGGAQAAAAGNRGPDSAATPNGGGGGAAAAAGGGAQAAPAPAPPPEPARPQEPRRIGLLKSFSPAQGYGFISCDELYQTHKRDVYFDRSQLPQSGYRFGMVVEFTCWNNARGHPQARSIDWDPIPQIPDRGAELGAPPPVPASQRNFSTATQETLKKLLRNLHNNEKEPAVLSAIDLQGGSGAGKDEEVDRDVDFVCFVLDRLGEPRDALSAREGAGPIRDFVKMLLLLMLAKMLRIPHTPERCQQIVNWFEVLTETIDTAGANVHEHFEGVVSQISIILKENAILKDGVLGKRLETALRTLQAKVPKPSSGG